MKLLDKRGQSIGEYAILFAIVLGAVVAMQNYVRNRIAGAIQTQALNYQAQAGGGALTVTQTSSSTSTSGMAMTSARAGAVTQTGTSTSTTTNPQ